ncbi:MAG TPA: flagellar biosynthesis protein FlhF, partial [Bacillota bacterium]|nr:flagellar biosynthesis protein FlhF [Bacillota bacterium]
PFEVAYNMEDYQQGLKRHKDCDLILVDTAGRNFRDKKYVKELESHIGFNAVVETFLVLSMTAKQKDIMDIYNQFKHLNIQQVIFTKLDETTQYGNILNVVYKEGVGVAYLTNGQEVPDDVIIPSSELITEYIAGERT